jgi:hypothetical protein
VRLVFDRGTLLVEDPPADLDLAAFPECRWDSRVGKHRAPAFLAYRIASDLRRRGIALDAAPRPALGPATGFRPVELRPYQDAALAAWRLAGRKGVVALPTGSGKTRVALAAIAATAAPCLVLVPTRALLAQWIAALAAMRASDAAPIGRFGDGERVLAPLTVATFAGAYRHMARIGDRFGLLIVDEAHHFGLAWHDEISRCRSRRCASGSPPRRPTPGPPPTRLRRCSGRSCSSARSPICRPVPGAARADHLAPAAGIRRSGASTTRSAPSTGGRGARTSGNHLGRAWEDFMRHAAQSDEGRRGRRRLAARPAPARVSAPQARGAGAAARAASRRQDAGVHGRQRDRLRRRARAPGHRRSPATSAGASATTSSPASAPARSGRWCPPRC